MKKILAFLFYIMPLYGDMALDLYVLVVFGPDGFANANLGWIAYLYLGTLLTASLLVCGIYQGSIIMICYGIRLINISISGAYPHTGGLGVIGGVYIILHFSLSSFYVFKKRHYRK